MQLSDRWAWMLVVLVIAGTAAIRARLLDLPLERDEGEYAYVGQLMLQGVPPYLDAQNMKLPGTHAAYALCMAVFGETAVGIHLGFLVVNAITIILLFLVGRRLFDATAGLLACAAFAVLALSPSMVGLAAHATHFLSLFAVAGALALSAACPADGSESRRLSLCFVSGLLFGLAFLMKQHGACFVLFGILFLCGNPVSLRNRVSTIALFLLGVSLPFVSTCAVLSAAGVFDRFWFWTFTYAAEYASHRTWADGWETLQSRIGPVIGSNVFLWIAAGIGLIAVWWAQGASRPRLIGTPVTTQTAIFISGFLLASMAAVSLGFYFRPHYFIVMLPALALLAGGAVTLISQELPTKAGRCLLLIGFVAALAFPLWQERDILFRLPLGEAAREFYVANPFIEAREISRYIREHSAAGDRIAILGSEPEIFFYSGRRSAASYLYVYPLMEEHSFARGMQEDMIAQIEAAQPKFIVFVGIPASWIFQPNSDKYILSWGEAYCQKYYELVGRIEMTREVTSYYWDEEARKHPLRSPLALEVYRRKADRN